MSISMDSAASLDAAIELINTIGPPDRLTGQWIDDWWQRQLYTGRRDRTRVELRELAGLRPRLRTLLTARATTAARQINRIFVETNATPQVTRHDGLGWHIHAAPPSSPFAQRVLIETAMATVDLIRLDEQRRVLTCDDARCDNLLLDLTRNRSRRYCSTTCANRNAAAAYRQRRSAG